MKRLLFSAFVALSCAWSASAQISPDSVAGLGIVHRYFYEWGKVGSVSFSTITRSIGTDTTRFLRLSWTSSVGTSVRSHNVTLTCQQVGEYLNALNGFVKIASTTPEDGHEYQYRLKNSDLELTLFGSPTGNTVVWRMAYEDMDDYTNNTGYMSNTNIQPFANYFRDFLLNCR